MTGAAPGGMRVAGHHLPPEILASIREASRATGVDFDFLVAQAGIESGFRGDVRSRTRHSSAAGLFQFTAQTWLQMVQQHGAKYGLGDLAERIGRLANGHLGVADKSVEKRILGLREDATLSAIFAGDFAKTNAAALHRAFHRKAGPAELHLAHLLGAAGAIRFLKARQADATQPAAAVLPAAARQNPSLFYGRGDHTPKTVAAVYGRIKHEIETPLKQIAAAGLDDGLRPGPGLIDALPGKRGDRV